MSKGRMWLRAGVMVLGALVLTAAGARAGDEDLFNADGFRQSAYRAPVPPEAPGARTVTLAEMQELREGGAVLLDVMGAQHFHIDEHGQWLTPEAHVSVPGAVWLPVVGWGALEDWQADYLRASLTELTGGDSARAIVVFCKTDCWLSWNVSRRISDLGYSQIAWFPGGIDGWTGAGLAAVETRPYPLRPGAARPAETAPAP